MSDSSAFRLLLLQPEHVKKYIDYEDKNTPCDSLVNKRITGVTRNDWFVTANRELIANAELTDAIKFLSNERRTVCHITGGDEVDYKVTGEYQVVPPEEWSLGNNAGYLREYTVILPDEITEVANQLEKLWSFCIKNIEIHHILSDYLSCPNGQELLSSLENYEDINNCPGSDEGNTSDFYFFALYSIKNIISESVGKDLAAVYVNETFVPVKKSG